MEFFKTGLLKGWSKPPEFSIVVIRIYTSTDLSKLLSWEYSKTHENLQQKINPSRNLCRILCSNKQPKFLCKSGKKEESRTDLEAQKLKKTWKNKNCQNNNPNGQNIFM